jgi:hypothetical protein
MKRAFPVIVLIFALGVVGTPPSQAIFGLSSCEKVKKSVLANEKTINELAISLSKYVGKNLPQNVSDPLLKLQDPKMDVVVRMLKDEFNNPKCFTRTQNLEINARRDAKWSLYTFIPYYRYAIVKSDEKCQGVLQKIEPSDFCLIRWEVKITDAHTITSIYES